ncbi:MAG: acyl-ACP--UDP-N-acetylglucosamine O-acyltransferase [Deltaproteobacteria bacterium]
MDSDNLPLIHETAIVSPSAALEKGVGIGPFSVIGPHVTIGKNAKIGPHVVIEGNTRIGDGVTVAQFASIGAPPQDLKYGGEPTRVEIGHRTVIREFVTVHRGTEKGGGITKVGSDCLIMAYCHIAHDCRVGDHVIMANGATLGGHVQVGDHVVIGGLSAVHQYCRIGPYAFLGGMSGVNKDIPPFTKYWGNRGKLYGLNLVGLRRNQFSREAIDALSKAYKEIFRGPETVSAAVARLFSMPDLLPEVFLFLDFIRSSQRGVPAAGSNGDEET